MTYFLRIIKQGRWLTFPDVSLAWVLQEINDEEDPRATPETRYAIVLKWVQSFLSDGAKAYQSYKAGKYLE